MTKIELNTDRCVRYYSKHSTCDLCEVVCPTNAIKIDNMQLAISLNTCIECGACDSICPNEAFNLENFSATSYFFNALKNDDFIISCKRDLPCIMALSIEHLVSLVIQKGNIDADLAHCNSCDIGAFKENIIKNIDEANMVLDSLNISNKIYSKDLAIKRVEQPPQLESNNRRELFNRLTLKGALKTQREFKDESANLDNDFASFKLDTTHIKGIKEQSLSDRRKILYTSLKNVDKDIDGMYLSFEKLSFISNKDIDNSCTNCSICYRLCPTGALSSDINMSKINFDMLSCVKCNLCHDVCESNSISLISIYSKQILDPQVRELLSFDIRRCDECANHFTYSGGELMCESCKTLEDDAKSLWRLN